MGLFAYFRFAFHSIGVFLHFSVRSEAAVIVAMFLLLIGGTFLGVSIHNKYVTN